MKILLLLFISSSIFASDIYQKIYDQKILNFQMTMDKEISLSKNIQQRKKLVNKKNNSLKKISLFCNKKPKCKWHYDKETKKIVLGKD